MLRHRHDGQKNMLEYKMNINGGVDGKVNNRVSGRDNPETRKTK